MDTCRLENPIGGLAAMTVLLVAAALRRPHSAISSPDCVRRTAAA